MSEDHTHGVCEKHGPWTKNGRCFECMAEAFGSKPPYDESAARIATLEASLALISDAMIRGSKRWRDAHPNSNIVIPDLANLVEWLLEQIQIRDGKIATLEAEVRRLTRELAALTTVRERRGLGFGDAQVECPTCLSVDSSSSVIKATASLRAQLAAADAIREQQDATLHRVAKELGIAIAERDEARAKICNACESEPYADSPCPCHHAPCRHDFNVKAKRVNDLEAQLATLSRCARNLCDDFEKYSLAVAKLLVDPNRQVFASEHAEHVALAAKVTESWKQARTSLAALDSGGGEGETNSPKNWESSK